MIIMNGFFLFILGIISGAGRFVFTALAIICFGCIPLGNKQEKKFAAVCFLVFALLAYASFPLYGYVDSHLSNNNSDQTTAQNSSAPADNDNTTKEEAEKPAKTEEEITRDTITDIVNKALKQHETIKLESVEIKPDSSEPAKLFVKVDYTGGSPRGRIHVMYQIYKGLYRSNLPIKMVLLHQYDETYDMETALSSDKATKIKWTNDKVDDDFINALSYQKDAIDGKLVSRGGKRPE